MIERSVLLRSWSKKQIYPVISKKFSKNGLWLKRLYISKTRDQQNLSFLDPYASKSMHRKLTTRLSRTKTKPMKSCLSIVKLIKITKSIQFMQVKGRFKLYLELWQSLLWEHKELILPSLKVNWLLELWRSLPSNKLHLLETDQARLLNLKKVLLQVVEQALIQQLLAL